MTTLYKFTDADGYTRRGESNECKWGENVTYSAKKAPRTLCTAGVIYAYEDPLIAVIMNPIHGNYKAPLLWESRGDIVVKDGALKCGCMTLTTVKKMAIPEITHKQRIAFAILCGKSVYKDGAWNRWANLWLSGEDRSRKSAYAAYAAADAAYADAAYAAAYAAAMLLCC